MTQRIVTAGSQIAIALAEITQWSLSAQPEHDANITTSSISPVNEKAAFAVTLTTISDFAFEKYRIAPLLHHRRTVFHLLEMFLKSRQTAIEAFAHLLIYGTITVTMESDVRNILAIQNARSAKEKYNIRGNSWAGRCSAHLPAAYMTKECSIVLLLLLGKQR